MNCQGYTRLIALGKQQEAAEEMRMASPFANILGRICSHPCEVSCERGKIDGSVHIRALKRYLADGFPDITLSLPQTPRDSGHRIAVVGSGPAGLSAAYELRLRGHAVTVFESDTNPGGLLRNVIPSFHLPISEVEKATTMLSSMGTNFITGEPIGQKIEFGRLEKEFDAVIIAVGASAPIKPDIPGQDLDNVIQGLDLLRKIKKGQKPQLGQSVIVVGGGNSAVDVAISCRLLGVKEVHIVCLERPDEMPAYERSLQKARNAGIIVENCWGPTRFIQGDGRSIEIEFSRCMTAFDDQGQFAPELEPTCGLTLQADTVVMAVGQKVKSKDLPEELIDPVSGRFMADRITLQSNINPRIFIAGECYSGTATVVDAMASGTEAAISADRFANRDGLLWGRDFWQGPYLKNYSVDHEQAVGSSRCKLKYAPEAKQKIDQEMEMTLSAMDAKKEAERCLSCGRSFEANKTCWYCLPCEIECPVDALEVRMPYQIR
jgi:NADPH-dependent glutamate synthase beta subunit-like oxidoreductase